MLLLLYETLMEKGIGEPPLSNNDQFDAKDKKQRLIEGNRPVHGGRSRVRTTTIRQSVHISPFITCTIEWAKQLFIMFTPDIVVLCLTADSNNCTVSIISRYIILQHHNYCKTKHFPQPASSCHTNKVQSLDVCLNLKDNINISLDNKEKSVQKHCY